MTHVQHVLSTSFQVLFLVHFLSFLMPFCVPFGTDFEKKTLPKIVSKKGAPLSQTTDYDLGPGLPDSPPRVRTSQTRNNSSSSKCCSNSCPCLWFRKIARTWLFELASIVNYSKKSKSLDIDKELMKRKCGKPTKLDIIVG